MRMNTYRIYGKVLESWEHEIAPGRVRTYQVELEYKEYNERGELVGVGSEDFSTERYFKELRGAWVWTWDGQKRNKGGYRWFELRCMTLYRRKEVKLVKEHYRRIYGAAAVDFRN